MCCLIFLQKQFPSNDNARLVQCLSQLLFFYDILSMYHINFQLNKVIGPMIKDEMKTLKKSDNFKTLKGILGFHSFEEVKTRLSSRFLSDFLLL